MFGCEPGEMIGQSPLSWHVPESHAIVREHIRANDDAPYEAICMRKNGARFPVEIRARPTTHEGRPARATAVRDITARQQAEEAAREALVRGEVLRAQKEALDALSTPLLPIRDDILVLPLIGAVSAERAEQAQMALLSGLVERRAQVAILDITGVPEVDASVAEALIRAARAARLLGARVILTGIGPDVAQRLVRIGADLRDIMTYGTLHGGVAHALRRR
jgi:anti-anti-sigma regulatory factor